MWSGHSCPLPLTLDKALFQTDRSVGLQMLLDRTSSVKPDFCQGQK
jgi:hypothetical protein